jgi:hypothetical protein
MSTTSRARTVLLALALSAAGFAGMGAASPSATPTPPPPGLSISIDNGATTTKPDSNVSYKVTLANSGTSPVTAWIVAGVPGYGKITDAGGGQAKGQNDTWKVTVEAGKKQTETLKAHIGTIPKGTYRVTALASVYLSDDTTGAPIIRSADSDAIPGVKEPVAAKPTPTASAPTHPAGNITAPVVIGILGALVIIAAAAIITLVLVRRTRQTGRRRRHE